jgi:hypothetical protein
MTNTTVALMIESTKNMNRTEAFTVFLRRGRGWYRTEQAAQAFAAAMIMEWDAR